MSNPFAVWQAYQALNFTREEAIVGYRPRSTARPSRVDYLAIRAMETECGLFPLTEIPEDHPQYQPAPPRGPGGGSHALPDHGEFATKEERYSRNPLGLVPAQYDIVKVI